jgi:hypothetical protein
MIAKRLAGPLYGGMISTARAKQMIANGVPDYGDQMR